MHTTAAWDVRGAEPARSSVLLTCPSVLQDVNMAQEAGARGAEHRQLCHQLSAALCSLAEMRMALAEEVAEVRGEGGAAAGATAGLQYQQWQVQSWARVVVSHCWLHGRQ